MSRTDLISDAFTIIRNASRIGKEEALVPHSNFLLKICQIFKREGYLENVKEIDVGNFKKIKIYLRYEKKKSVISEIKRISKPGRKIYVSKENIPSVLHGFGIAIISTSKGLFTDKEAKVEGIGGEIVGTIW